jgi:hypothetical protein
MLLEWLAPRHRLAAWRGFLEERPHLIDLSPLT